MFLSVENSKIMKAASFHVGFKVIKSIILLYLLPMFGEGTFFGSFFSCGSHVIEPREETMRLGCDDRNRESSSEMMEDEALLRVRDWATLKQRDVLSFSEGKFLDQIMKVLRDFSILAGHETEDVAKSSQSLLQRSNMPSCSGIVFYVDLSCFVSV